MDFFSAMDKMKNGHLVKLKCWQDKDAIGVSEEEKKVFGSKRIKYTVVTQDEMQLSPSIPFSVLVSSEWELVKE